MKSVLKRVYEKFKKKLSKGTSSERNKPAEYDFNKSNPLGGNGERVDIQLQNNYSFENLDMYQKNHIRRYEYAKGIIDKDEVCGDFACGTGYGSILLSDKAKYVIGADINSEVISQIKMRYEKNKKVTFLNENLLNLSYTHYFDSIISFETIEHFDETDIKKLFKLFSSALKPNGKLIFSTPFMQERSEIAIKIGFHLTFYINEEKISNWLSDAGLKLDFAAYQNYDTHTIQSDLLKKEFIICIAQKIAL